jgi:hypothetical protein
MMTILKFGGGGGNDDLQKCINLKYDAMKNSKKCV